MKMPSSFIIFQCSIVVLLLTPLITTTNIPQPTSFIAEMSQSYDDQRHSPVVYSDQQNNLDNLPSSSKHLAFNTDENSESDEEYDNDDSKSLWPEMMNKRYANKAMGGGDSRIWAIPYRFGKRAAMPYRFGKRSGMHFRFGKKNAF